MLMKSHAIGCGSELALLTKFQAFENGVMPSKHTAPKHRIVTLFIFI